MEEAALLLRNLGEDSTKRVCVSQRQAGSSTKELVSKLTEMETIRKSQNEILELNNKDEVLLSVH